MQRGGDVSRRLGVTHLPTGDPFDVRRGGGHRVAIDQRGEEPAIDETGKRNMLRSGREAGDDLVTLPGAPEVKTKVILATTAITMGKGLRIVILDDGRRHGSAPRQRPGFPPATDVAEDVPG